MSKRQRSRKTDTSSGGGIRPKREKSKMLLGNLLAGFILACLITFILFILKGRPQVEIGLNLTRVSFRVADPRAARLFNSVPTESLRLVNFGQVELGEGNLEIATSFDSKTNKGVTWDPAGTGTPDEYVLFGTGALASVSFEGVTLNELELLPDSLVTFEWVESEPNTLKATVGKPVSGEIATGAALELSCDHCAINNASGNSESKVLRMRGEPATGRIVRFSGGDEKNIIHCQLRSDVELTEQNILIGSDPDFRLPPSGRDMSSIKAGSVKIENVKDPIKIEKGDFVFIKDSDNLRIKTIAIREGIDVTFSGDVGTLLVGPNPDEGLKDLIPPLLQQILNNPELILLGAVLSAIITFFINLFEVYGKITESLRKDYDNT